MSLSELKANFSQLVEMAAQGESFLITKHGKPIAKVVAADASAQTIAPSAGQ